MFEAMTIKRMELLVLSTLKWRMQAVTACSFIDYFLCKFNDHDTPSMLAFSCSTDLILSTAKCMKVKSDPPFQYSSTNVLNQISLLVSMDQCVDFGAHKLLKFQNFDCRS